MAAPVKIQFRQAAIRELKLDLSRPAANPLALSVMTRGGGGSRAGIRAQGEVLASLRFATTASGFGLLDPTASRAEDLTPFAHGPDGSCSP